MSKGAKRVRESNRAIRGKGGAAAKGRKVINDNQALHGKGVVAIKTNSKKLIRSRLEIPTDSGPVLGSFHGGALWACPGTSDGEEEGVGFGLVTRCVIQTGVMTFHAECGGYAYDAVLARIPEALNGFRGEWKCADESGSVALRLLKDNNGYLIVGKWDENGPHKFFVELIPD